MHLWDERPTHDESTEPDSSADAGASRPLSRWHSLSQVGPSLAPDRPTDADSGD